MKKNKKYYKDALILLSVSLFMWIFVTTLIQRFKCTNMTETEMLIHAPKSFVLDWKKCD